MQGLRRGGDEGGSTPPAKDAPPFAQMRNLVMVACHAVYTGADYTKPLDFDSWFLLDYQKARVAPAT